MPVRSKWVPRVGLGLLALVVGYAIVSLSIGEGGPQGATVHGVDQVQQLFGGVPQEEAQVGPADAETTIDVFTDLRCAPCANWEIDEIDPLVEEYARPRIAQLELRHLSLGDEPTTLAAIAATAAGEQGREWQFADLVVRNLDLAKHDQVDQAFLDDIAESVPELDVDRWKDDLDDPSVTARVESDETTAADLGLPASGPSVVVTGPGGSRTLTDYPSQAEIEAAVRELAD